MKWQKSYRVIWLCPIIFKSISEKLMVFFFHLNSFSLLCQPRLTYFSPVSHFYNVRKPLVFWRFQRVWKYDTGLKWVKAGMSEKDGLKWIITMIFSQISLKLVGQNKTRKGGRVIHLKKLWYVSEKLFIWSEQWQRQGREEKERERKKVYLNFWVLQSEEKYSKDIFKYRRNKNIQISKLTFESQFNFRKNFTLIQLFCFFFPIAYTCLVTWWNYFHLFNMWYLY